VSVPPLTPLAVAVLRVGKPERILVVGCGEGEAAFFLAREFPAARVRGLDRDEGAVRRAAARIGLDPEGRVAFKTGSPRNLPFPDDGCDLLVVLDAPPAPAEAARVLRPGGRLLLVSTRGAPANGWRERLLWRRLARHGIEAVESTRAGEGGYSLARLRDRGSL
jgi:ubiquinone/menaquinone biosynthesis C-methylase UbiE